MTTPRENLTRIRAVGANLNPEQFAREIDAISGGVKAWNASPAPARSAEQKRPMFDRVDRDAQRVKRQYEGHLSGALKLLSLAWALETELCRRLTLEAAQKLVEEESGTGTCENCARVVERTTNDRLRGGRCRNCYSYRREHGGDERPKELWEKELEGEA